MAIYDVTSDVDVWLCDKKCDFFKTRLQTTEIS